MKLYTPATALHHGLRDISKAVTACSSYTDNSHQPDAKPDDLVTPSATHADYGQILQRGLEALARLAACSLYATK